MVRALLEMRVRPGLESQFQEAWLEVARMAAEAPGNVRQALLQDPRDNSSFVISTDWLSLDDFHAFERSPEQDALTAPLRALRESASMSILEVRASFEGPQQATDLKEN